RLHRHRRPGVRVLPRAAPGRHWWQLRAARRRCDLLDAGRPRGAAVCTSPAGRCQGGDVADGLPVGPAPVPGGVGHLLVAQRGGPIQRHRGRPGGQPPALQAGQSSQARGAGSSRDLRGVGQRRVSRAAAARGGGARHPACALRCRGDLRRPPGAALGFGDARARAGPQPATCAPGGHHRWMARHCRAQRCSALRARRRAAADGTGRRCRARPLLRALAFQGG
ncbi:unnamed protein product, partial [Prorocentrum cordatum]